MDLKCRNTDCKYNDKYSCTQKGITITQSLVCGAFEKADVLPPEQKQDVSKTMLKKTPKIHPYRHNKKINIACKANQCLFNKEGTCRANGISVLNLSKAKCGTYIIK